MSIKNKSIERKRRKIDLKQIYNNIRSKINNKHGIFKKTTPPPPGRDEDGGGSAEGVGGGGVLTVQRTESRELFPSIIEIYTLTSHLTKL